MENNILTQKYEAFCFALTKKPSADRYIESLRGLFGAKHNVTPKFGAKSYGNIIII